jgi:hypothetical protein
MLHIGLYVSVKVSFNCMFCLLISHMWNLSYVFDFSFQYVRFSLLPHVSYSCPISVICCANSEHCPLFFMSLMCYFLSVSYVFFISRFEHSPCLPYISAWTLCTLQLVHTTQIIFVGGISFYTQVVFILFFALNDIPTSVFLNNSV